jgi:hypothetical protein
MALYVGSSKKKLMLGKELQTLNIYTKQVKPVKALLSSDNYMLKDKNDLYLITKDGE